MAHLFKIISWTVVALIFLTPATQAKPDRLPVAAFAKLPSMSQPALSPDASHIAYLSPIRGQNNLIIAPLDGSRAPDAIPPVEETDIIWFAWVNDERLIVSYRYTNNAGPSNNMRGDFARTALFSVHRSEPGYVDMAREPRDHEKHPYARTRPQFRDDVIDMLPDDPEHFLLAIDSNFDRRAEVRKVNVETGRYSKITEGYDWIRTWVTDQSHQHRLGWGMSPEGLRLVYIDPDSNNLKEINDVAWYAEKDIYPWGFTDDPHVVYASEPFEGDKRRLVTMDIRTGQILSVVFEHPNVDITGYVREKGSGKIIGVHYTDDLPRIRYIDPKLDALQAQLDAWLPGGSNMFRSWNSEKQIYIIRHVTDRETSYYLLDMAGGGSRALARSTPIPPELLAPSYAYDIPTRDSLNMRSYLTLPKDTEARNLPLVVLPHGGPHSRDDITYDYLSQFLANRGYAVLRPNFRGSTGFGRKFRDAGEGQWGGKMQDDVTDATHWAIEQGIADPARICIAGGSYGGYAALMGAIKESELYACAVSFNGVANLSYMTERLKNGFWMKDYAKTVQLEGEGVKAVSPYHQAERLKTPVLIVHAKDDPIVPFEQADDMRKRLKKLKKNAAFVALDAADHYFDTEESRVLLLTEIEKFLAKHLDR